VTYTIFGLPTHVLVIHLVIVGIPVACLATVAIAVRPQWRMGRIGMLVVVADALAVAATWIARQSGLAFFHRQAGGLATAPAVIDHKNLGMTLIWYMLGLLGAALLLVLAEKYERPPLTTIFATIAIAASVAAAVQTVRVGDAGARATWSSYIK
jgi:hypothetical protein